MTVESIDMDGQVPEPEWELPLAIVASGEAAPSVARLEAIWRRGPQRLADVEAGYIVADLHGLVAPWPGDEPRVTLSPLGAERLGVRLDGASRSWVPRGKRQLHPHTDPGRNRLVTETDAWICLDGMASRVATPLEALIRGEAARREAEASPRRAHPSDPVPTVLLGERLQWPVTPLVEVQTASPDRDWPRAVARVEAIAEVCPSCHGKPRPHEYCLVCDRYGREWMLPHVSRVVRRQSEAPAKAKAPKGRRQRRAEAFGKA